MFFVVFEVFSFVRVVLYTVSMVFPLPKTLVKTLAKNVVQKMWSKSIRKNNVFVYIRWGGLPPPPEPPRTPPGRM